MAVNHVVINGETILDMRGATATAADIPEGLTAFGATGELLVGTAVPGGGTLTVNAPAGCTATIAKETETRSEPVGSSGSVTFKGLSSGTWTVEITNGSQTATKTVYVSTDYSVTMTFFSATIAVTYPSGSTVTCSDGVTTLTATTTTGSYTFTVPNSGTWAVTCTDGSSSDSEDVSITADGQTVSVTLAYGLYLYNNGAVSGYTWTAEDDWDSGPYATIKDKGTYMELFGDYNSYAMFRTKNKVNVSGYKTLKMQLTNASMNVEKNGIYFGLSSDTTVDGSGMSTKTKYSSFSGSKELSCDISAVTRSMYVALSVSTPDDEDSTFSARMTKCWLE